jgi:4-hydroxybenzoate polyprenyltransferase
MSRRLPALVRLVHPFPSILDGLVTAAIALAAGGGAVVATVLGVAMTCLQFGIGAVNDVVDAEHDARERPAKPIPAGAIGRDAALIIAIGSISIGLSLSAPFGPAILLVAIIGTGAGLIYDVALKGTAWAWVAYAVAIPLLPVYAWLGATGSLPAAFLVLVPVAAIEGAALALANPLTDVDPDRRSGSSTPAVRLGRRRTWWATAALQLVAAGLALGSLAVLDGAETGAAVALLGGMLIAVGLGLSRPGPSARLPRRQLGWEIQAVGAGVLAVGWVLAVLVDGAG